MILILRNIKQGRRGWQARDRDARGVTANRMLRESHPEKGHLRKTFER